MQIKQLLVLTFVGVAAAQSQTVIRVANSITQSLQQVDSAVKAFTPGTNIQGVQAAFGALLSMTQTGTQTLMASGPLTIGDAIAVFPAIAMNQALVNQTLLDVAGQAGAFKQSQATQQVVGDLNSQATAAMGIIAALTAKLPAGYLQDSANGLGAQIQSAFTTAISAVQAA